MSDELGKTGEFPEGKIDDDDEGEIRFTIGVKDDVVILDFGTSVTWLGLPPDNARELASMLLKNADVAEGK